jgi:imidazolonepropionase-like amidohydrolase
MRRISILGLLGLFLGLPCVHAQTNSTLNPPTRIALRAARLMDGKHDTAVTNAVVIVERDKIAAVGSGLTIPAGTTVIDLGDQTLLPGLIDAHTHLLLQMDGENLRFHEDGMLRVVATESTAERALLGAKLAREDLEAGITAVRDLGNSGVNGDVALSEAIMQGWVPGPTIVPSTRALAAPGGQFTRLIPEAQKIIEQEYVIINGPESARQAVRQALYDGAWCIKVIVNGSPADVTLDELKAIVDQAHTSKVKVAAHATDDHATRIAVEAGVDSVEHGYEIQDDVLKLMAQRHIFLVPTDSTAEGYFAMENGNRPMSGEERARLMEKYKARVASNGDRLRRAIAAGVPIAAGSDVWQSWPGKTRGQASLAMLEAYAEEGMKPAEIIRAATSSAAELIGGLPFVGTIEKGKSAYIIAVPGDPLTDPTALEHARFVMRRGEIVKNQK